eukprot:TRINITY_DN6262_c0_g1_i1.p2 TRINITY_DN6262_c0_g1~~TRINITY_DN6262_c0_g1_i1.p2  ORF type:complete len:301 (-),score=74.77 TRINITY_DN6262_c0_g1_i1:1028-1906(-)
MERKVDDEWSVATGKKKTFKPNKSQSENLIPTKMSNGVFLQTESRLVHDPKQSERLVRLVNTRLDELVRDGLIENFEELLTQVLGKHHQLSTAEKIDIVCYGIGRIEVFRNAQYQLALLVGLIRRKHVSQLVGRFEFYDPMLTTLEVKVIEQLGGVAIDHNEQGKRRVQESGNPILFYMPHCVRAMYNNILWANWGRSTMENIVVIGNSFSGYMDQVRPTKRGKTDSQALTRNCIEAMHSRGAIVEHCFENNFPVISSFNDLSIHVFDMKNAEEMNDANRPAEFVVENEVLE